jgi:hypothetical protein
VFATANYKKAVIDRRSPLQYLGKVLFQSQQPAYAKASAGEGGDKGNRLEHLSAILTIIKEITKTNH